MAHTLITWCIRVCSITVKSHEGQSILNHWQLHYIWSTMKKTQRSKLLVLWGDPLVDSRPKGPVPCHDVYMAAGYGAYLSCPGVRILAEWRSVVGRTEFLDPTTSGLWNGIGTARRNNSTWWRHQMETFSALLVICAGNSPVTGEFPTQRPVTWSFNVFFHMRLNKQLSKQSWGWWFETPSRPLWRYCNEPNLLVTTTTLTQF